MENIQSKHLEEYGKSPEFSVRVPGVIRFLGLFAEYSMGRSLCAADSRNLYLCVSKREDSQVMVFNSQVNDRKHFILSNLKFRKEDRWANYIKGVIAELITEGYEVSGMDWTLGGDILNGDSQVISCAVIVAACLAMEYVLNIRLEEHVLRRMVIKACMTFSGEVFNTSILVSMLNAEHGKFVYYDNYKDSLELLDDPFAEGAEYGLYNINSGLPSPTMADEINRKYNEIMNLVEDLRMRPGIFPFSNLSESVLRERVSDLREEEKKICLYLFEEYRAADFPSFSCSAFAKAMVKTEKALRNRLELSFPELDWLIKRACEDPACLAATIALNGGNGNISLILKNDAVDSCKAKLEEYEHIFGFKVRVSRFFPSSGAEVFRK